MRGILIILGIFTFTISCGGATKSTISKTSYIPDAYVKERLKEVREK